MLIKTQFGMLFIGPVVDGMDVVDGVDAMDFVGDVDAMDVVARSVADVATVGYTYIAGLDAGP